MAIDHIILIAMKYILVLFLVGLISPKLNVIGEDLFRHHTVSEELPDHGSGARYGTPALGDFDNDGDVDYAMSITGHELLWFEYLDGQKWKMHKAGEVVLGQLAGGTLDVDGDGWTDIVMGGYWYKNSGNPRNEEFKRMEYDETIGHEMHDLVFADMNGNQRKDVVIMGDKDGCFWYEIPKDPLKTKIWPRHTVSLEILDGASDIHGGIFPGGVGDIDGDGDADIVMPNRWYENENGGIKWSRQFLPFGSGGYWGLSGRSQIIDIDSDGDNDIVMVNCDQKDSRGAWLENNGQDNPSFVVHLLPFSASGRRGSFHSLWVADFDLDGDPDIFTMDQEDHKILPEGGGMRAYIWENVEGDGSDFAERIVFDKNIGGHDCQFVDADGDGDLDAYFKVWSPLNSSAYNGKPHVDYFENTTLEP